MKDSENDTDRNFRELYIGKHFSLSIVHQHTNRRDLDRVEGIADTI